jgi:hypothetical protein
MARQVKPGLSKDLEQDKPCEKKNKPKAQDNDNGIFLVFPFIYKTGNKDFGIQIEESNIDHVIDRVPEAQNARIRRMTGRFILVHGGPQEVG